MKTALRNSLGFNKYGQLVQGKWNMEREIGNKEKGK